jgi:hypothetical protein
VATAVYRFEPEITINEELMNTLTEEEKIAFVNASPAPVGLPHRNFLIVCPCTSTYSAAMYARTRSRPPPHSVPDTLTSSSSTPYVEPSSAQ